MKPDFDNSFWSYTYYRHAKLVWLKRSQRKLQTLEELKAALGGLLHSLQQLPRTELKILSDLRDGPALRNDPQFEVALLPARQQLFEGFSQSAIIAKTAVGVLQVNRYNREAQLNIRVFTNQEEALSFLGYSTTPTS
jgi:hypothetical protein